MVQSKPQTLLNTWVEWSESVLNKKHSDKFTTPTGFQDKLNSATSHHRSRALECYQIGLLKGRLVNSQNNIGDIPKGWSLIQDDSSCHSKLGFIGYAIGKGIQVDEGNEIIQKGLSAFATIALLQIGIESSGKRCTISSLYNYILNNFPKPNDVDELEWHDYLAIAMFSNLKKSGLKDKLLDSFFSNKTLDKLTIIYKDAKGENQIAINSKQLVPTIKKRRNEILPKRKSNYWFGNTNNSISEGFYLKAVLVGSMLLEEVSRIERRAFKKGNRNPLIPLLSKPSSGSVNCVLEVSTDLFKSYENTRRAWGEVMKSLYEGVVESLKYVSDSQSFEIDKRTFFADKPEVISSGDGSEDLLSSLQSNSAKIAEVDVDSCIANPEIGDQIVIEGITFEITDISQLSNKLVLSINNKFSNGNEN